MRYLKGDLPAADLDFHAGHRHRHHGAADSPNASRTIFPLLAKPVTRGPVILGKFLGCWFACGLALLIFYAFFTVVTCSREGHWPLGGYLQALWLQWMMLAIVIALALLGSLIFAAPSSNTTICFVVVAGILLLGGHLNAIALQQTEPLTS